LQNSVNNRIIWVVISICVSVILILGLAFGLLRKNIWNYLVINQEPKSADVIVVLSGGTDRVTEGVRLYQLGYAHKVLFTGSSARRMSRQAQTLGLPAGDVLIEGRSQTTFGNAKYSLEVIRSQRLRSAIIVTSPYHTRRASLMFGYFSQGLDFTMVSAQYDLSLSNNWWRDSTMFEAVVSEYLKLAWFYVFEKWLPDA